MYKESAEHASLRQSEELKLKFINQSITPQEFLRSIFDLDQSEADQGHASEILTTLLSPEVTNHFKNDNELGDDYQFLLAFVYFHVAQQLAGKDDESAKEYFDLSVRTTELIGWEDQGLKQELLYREATLYYFTKDLPKLNEVYSKMDEDLNKRIVANLIQGLETTGQVNYERDYRSL